MRLLIGQARNYLQYAGTVEGKQRSEDDLAYLRAERQFMNVEVVEMPNGDYAHTIARCFLYDAWHLPLQQALMNSADEQLAAIAAKAVKEMHLPIEDQRRLDDPLRRWHRGKSPPRASCAG